MNAHGLLKQVKNNPPDSLRVSCPILFEFLICPDARLKPQGLGGSYLQRVLRGFRMSIHLMFHVFAAFLAASF